jgi:uncharacterized protein
MKRLVYLKTKLTLPALCLSALYCLLANGRAADSGPAGGVNLALVATTSTSYVSGHETIMALNDGFTPENSDDKTHGAYGNWPRNGTQWVQYEWPRPISTAGMDVYWFDDNRGVRLPKACRLLQWNGSDFEPVPEITGLGLDRDKFNHSSFPEVTTSRLRLEFDSNGTFSTGVLEWRVYDSGKSPNFPPAVLAGVDRVVVLPGRTYLTGSARDDGKPSPTPKLLWRKESGPGKVTFASPGTAETSAAFSTPGQYVLKLTADDGELKASGTLLVTVDPPAPRTHLSPAWPKQWQITSSFWQPRIKNLILHWIPHCIAKIDDPKLPEGGIENFVQAANKLAGRPAQHVGAPFANAWVYNTVESMCLALTVGPQGDQEMASAQKAIQSKLEEWIPKILSAQEPDGYLQTLYTINNLKRWSNKSDHEGYNAGYFIEAAMAHYLMTGGKDTRLIDAAKRLADCWCKNIGRTPKQYWYEGHEELEQCMVRFSRFMDQKDGNGSGRKYLELAKFLLDSRRDGDEYDQSHAPVTRQYEAVGHAVRAVYCYSGMADVAMETGDVDYQSAVKSIWSSVVNRKYYVTGGVGSGETPEGFGKEYSLPNHAYCESCAGCGELFFQYKMQLAYQEARYADLYEETLYNGILGSVDLPAENFTYTNPLDSSEKRYKWHVCPCCVGNIPRTLLMLPSWMYSTDPDRLYVNLFAGTTVTLTVGDAPVELIQTTDYPWNGKVSLTINPVQPKRFTLKLRVPNRNVSTLYTAAPRCESLSSFSVNGTQVKSTIENGYATVTRKWKAGDKVEWVVPMQVQRVRASSHIRPLAGMVALRYGPLIYNFESVDQKLDSILQLDSLLSTEWNPGLLGGVLVIKAASAEGQPLMAIPNYARLNRGGRSIIWIKEK